MPPCSCCTAPVYQVCVGGGRGGSPRRPGVCGGRGQETRWGCGGAPVDQVGSMCPTQPRPHPQPTHPLPPELGPKAVQNNSSWGGGVQMGAPPSFGQCLVASWQPARRLPGRPIPLVTTAWATAWASPTSSEWRCVWVGGDWGAQMSAVGVGGWGGWRDVGLGGGGGDEAAPPPLPPPPALLGCLVWRGSTCQPASQPVSQPASQSACQPASQRRPRSCGSIQHPGTGYTTHPVHLCTHTHAAHTFPLSSPPPRPHCLEGGVHQRLCVCPLAWPRTACGGNRTAGGTATRRRSMASSASCRRRWQA